MKKEFEDKKNFDMDRIKSLEKKRIVWNALNYMQLTLTPLLYINYLPFEKIPEINSIFWTEYLDNPIIISKFVY